ncbi:MAG: hypothetical protein A3G24_08260 [Betaproteobacteria bacterium RIFCSPLOWO2_12_FULL_62_13]|nr:MAG: hypothetical protein A3G24_08260 [Betaproteobacteria bacterium RIFCSPLOWO2_12_FULL_62_13]
MAKERKQEVAVSTKGGEIQKAAPRAVGRVMRPFGDFDRLFERAFGRDWMRPLAWGGPPWREPFESAEGRLPTMDVIDRDDDILVRAEIPGVDKKDLEVSISDNVLTVKGSMSREEKEETGDYYRREISGGAFSRSVMLPANVDSSKVNATLKDGILEVTLPKTERSKRRSVKVQ